MPSKILAIQANHWAVRGQWWLLKPHPGLQSWLASTPSAAGQTLPRALLCIQGRVSTTGFRCNTSQALEPGDPKPSGCLSLVLPFVKTSFSQTQGQWIISTPFANSNKTVVWKEMHFPCSIPYSHSKGGSESEVDLKAFPLPRLTQRQSVKSKHKQGQLRGFFYFVSSDLDETISQAENRCIYF